MFRHRRLLAFEAVCRYGSALKAADYVHMAQPSITAAITALEGDLGAPLCARTSKGMTPTAEGAVFLNRVERALGHLKDAENLIASRRHDRVRVPVARLITSVQIRALSAVIQASSFSEAARRLDLSQPSVHRSVRELETLCGIALMQNQPTPEARELARHFALYQAELVMGRDEVREVQGQVAGTVTIGALPLARSGWLPDAVAATLASYPDAQIRVVDGPYDVQLHGLLHGEIDFILGALRDPAPSKLVAQKHLFDDPLTIVVRADHPLAPGFDSDRDKLTQQQLDSLAWILPRLGTPGRNVFEQFMAYKGLKPPQRVIECASLVTARALLLRTDMAALLSARQVDYEIRQGLLKIMGPPLTGSTRSIGITTRAGFRPTLLHRVMLGHLDNLHS